MGYVKSGTTAGLSCLCLPSSTPLQLPAAVLVLSVRPPPCCSLPAPRSSCHSFALHQNSSCVDVFSLPYLPCLLWLSPKNLITFGTLAVLHYFLYSFALFCHSIYCPLAPRRRVVGTVIRVLGRWDVRKLVTSWLLLGGRDLANSAA